MARGLDHIVHAVRDLDAAAEFYRRLGFTVGARNKHPWGTHNHIVQMPGFFIELLTVAEPEKLGTDGFSVLFGKYNQDFLKRGEGLSLLILESTDAHADAASFSSAGIAGSEVMRFEREGKRPDGSTVKVAFSLAFADDAKAPDIHFSTCQQHYPENFWNPAFQTHKNGVQGVAGVVMVAGKPSDHRDFIARYTGVGELRGSGNSLVAKTPRGELAVMDPMAFGGAFGNAAPSVMAGARLAAMRFVVADVSAVEELLRQANVGFNSSGNRVVIGAGVAMGATIAFEEAASSAR